MQAISRHFQPLLKSQTINSQNNKILSILIKKSILGGTISISHDFFRAFFGNIQLLATYTKPKKNLAISEVMDGPLELVQNSLFGQ